MTSLHKMKLTNTKYVIQNISINTISTWQRKTKEHLAYVKNGKYQPQVTSASFLPFPLCCNDIEIEEEYNTAGLIKRHNISGWAVTLICYNAILSWTFESRENFSVVSIMVSVNRERHSDRYKHQRMGSSANFREHIIRGME